MKSRSHLDLLGGFVGLCANDNLAKDELVHVQNIFAFGSLHIISGAEHYIPLKTQPLEFNPPALVSQWFGERKS